MAQFTATCDYAAPENETTLLALVVQTDGEDYHSRLYRVTHLGSESTPPEREELFYINSWLTSVWRSDQGEIFLSDETGEIHHFANGAWSAHQLPTDDALTIVWGRNGNEVYAAGDAGIVFRWNGVNWATMSDALGERLYSIHGTFDRDLYVCGARGSFWRHNAGEWTKIELPTNVRLTAVCSIENGETWVCGERGMLFHGNGENWEQLFLTDADLHGVCSFRNAIYLAGSTEGIYLFVDESLDLIKDTVISYGVVSGESGVVSFGDKIVIKYDGASWAGVRFD